MEVQRLLRSGLLSLDDLREEYGIRHKRHGRFPNLVQFEYHQYDSPPAEPVVRECRGLILDQDDSWRVVARPFDRFFNLGEPHADRIDWSTARAQEKLDGSLTFLYHHAGEWHVATRGSPDASGRVTDHDLTFRELFWRTWREEGFSVPHGREDLTLMFELTSQLNRQVVSYTETHLTLIGVRDRSGREELVSDWSGRFRVVREFPLTSVEDVLRALETLDPLQQEGYVVVDGGFGRVKVKRSGYVALHRLRSSASPRLILEVVRRGEDSELLVHFPEMSDVVLAVREEYDRLVDHLETACEEIRGIGPQGEFALRALETRFPSALFALRSGKVGSVREFLDGVPVRSLVRVLGLRGPDDGT